MVTKKETDFDFEALLDKYDYKFQIGTWIYYMSYKRAVVKRTGQINEYGSPTRSALQALYKYLS